jgi:uncharacterized protein (TIGR02270 family)
MLLLDVLEEHADEMSFLFSQRLYALDALTLDFAFLTGLDERLEAHLDGLLVGTDSSWELCQPLLGGEHPEEAFVAWSVALRSPPPWSWADELPAALPDGPALDGVLWALRLSTGERTDAVLGRLLGSESDSTRGTALDAMTFRHGDPGPALREALRSPSLPLLRAGLAGAARLRLTPEAGRALELVASDDPGIAGAALMALVVLDPEKAHDRSLAALSAAGPAAPAAVRALGILGRTANLAILQRAAGSGEKGLARAAILALGNLGAAAAVPPLLDMLKDDEKAGLAAVALRRILGPDAPWEPAPAAKAGGEEAGEAEEEAPWDPDEDLPRWSADKLTTWWRDNQKRFEATGRFREGQPFTPGPPRATTPLALRHDEALEDAIASPGRPLRETRDLASRQQG